MITSSRVQDRIVISGCIYLITLLAWFYLVLLDRKMDAEIQHVQMMAAPGMTMDIPCMSTDVVLTFGMWLVMMIGMMAPSASPMFLLFHRSSAARGERAWVATLAFGVGYAVVWAGFSLGATGAQWGLHQAALLSPIAMALASARLSAVVLLAAGIYQLTVWKSKCLVHCRSPLEFLISNWRQGALGAFGMGLRHGTYCLGCCFVLMCILFVVGVMNLLWIAALAVLVLIEKIGPAGVTVARVAGIALACLGLLLLF